MSDVSRLVVRFARNDPRGFARTLGQAGDAHGSATVLEQLRPADAAAVAAALTPQSCAAILERVPDAAVVQWLQAGSLDRAAQLFARLPASRRRTLLALVESGRRRRQLLRLTGYSADNVGAFVRTNTLTLQADSTSTAALAELRKQRRVPGSPLVVLAEDNHVVGLLDPLDLLTANASDTPIRTLARKVTTVLPDMPVQAAVLLPAWSQRSSLPVVDFNGALLGHVTHSALLHALDRQMAQPAAHTLTDLARQYFDTLVELLALLLVSRR